MSEEKNKHQRPLHRFHVPLNSDKSRFEIVPRIEHFNVMTRPGQAMRSEQADLFLLALSGLVHWLSWTVFAVNTGENIAVNSQFSVSEQDSSLLTSALAASFPASDFARGNNIYQVLLANIVTNREHYRQCELELCDIHELQKKDHWSNTRLFGVASALDPGEALFQDVIAFPAQYERGIATAFNTSIRYGIVTSKGRKEKFRKALFGEDEEFYTLSDFMRHGFSWKQIMDMLINRRVYRKALLVPTKRLSPYFIIPWSAPAYKKAGITIQELQGNKPHPDLFTGIPVGYSLYDNTRRLICIPFSYYENSSVYILGETGSGKTNLIMYYLHPILQRQVQNYSTCVIDYKHELIYQLLGMIAPSNIDFTVCYAPREYPFKCNIMHGLSTKEFVSFLARMVEVRHEYGLTSNAAELLRWAVRAHQRCGNAVTIRHLKAFIADEQYRNKLIHLNPDPELRDFVDNILPTIPDVSHAAAFSKLESFLDEPLFSSTCQSVNCMNFPQFFSGGKNVFVELSGLTYEEIADLGTCLFTHASQAAFQRRYDTDAIKVKIVMDEFHTYYSGPLIDKVLNQGRQYNVSAVLSHQSGSQLDSKVIQNIIAAARIRACFRVQARDALFMSSLFGVPAEELASLNKYEAYLQIGNYPSVKIHTLPPLDSSDDIRKQAITLSQEKYGAEKIDRIDPYDLLKTEQTKTQKRKNREYDEL